MITMLLKVIRQSLLKYRFKIIAILYKDFFLQKCDVETFIHYRKHFIDRYTMIHQCIDASQYHPISNTSHSKSIEMAS